MMQTSIMIVGPQEAEAFLAHNAKNNRKISQSYVETLACIIRNGKWMLTHQGIAFNERGELIDGQHRLSAIVQAGIAVPLMVTTGENNNAILLVDNNKGRNARDAMRMKYGAGYQSDSNIISCVRFMMAGFGYSNTIYSNQEIEAYILGHDVAIAWIYQFATRGHKGSGRIGVSLRSAGFLCALLAGAICGEPEEAIFEFVDLLINNNPPSKPYNIKAALSFKDKVTAVQKHNSRGLQIDKFTATKEALWLFCNNRTRLPKGMDPSDLYPITDEQIRAFGSEAKEAAL